MAQTTTAADNSGGEVMIRVENLVKTFGARRAVDDISFTVARGDVLGFIGPNGAGKSTTMRIITGFYPPTSGRVTVGGYDIAKEPIAAKRLMGYLPENAPSYADMTVHAFLNFAAEIRGLKGLARKNAVSRAVETCLLGNVLYQTIDTLSKGYTHRTGLAQAILHDPDILILDEPTDGLDPNQKHEVRNLIRRMGEHKVIVFSTHILEEVEETCNRVIIIDRGRLVADDTPQGLKQRSPMAGAVRMAVRGAAAGLITSRLSPLVQRTEVLGDSGERVELLAYPRSPGDDGGLLDEITKLARAEQWILDETRIEAGRLDEVFRAITLPDTVAPTAK